MAAKRSSRSVPHHGRNRGALALDASVASIVDIAVSKAKNRPRVDVRALSAFAHRSARFALNIADVWPDASDSENDVAWVRAMPNFRPIDRDIDFLLPPSVQEWLPEGHLARYVVEVVEGVDLRELEQASAGRGSEPYHPATLLALLIYGYATGCISTRKIERATVVAHVIPRDFLRIIRVESAEFRYRCCRGL
jgi:hypothetical protein